MACKLIKRTVGQKSNDKAFILECRIKDFCCYDDDIFVIHDKGIGRIHDGDIDMEWHLKLGYTQVPDFTTFNAICTNVSNHSLVVVGNGGSRVYEIDVPLTTLTPVMSEGSFKRFEKKYFQRPSSTVYVTAKGSKVYWSVKELHRCFQIKSNRIELLLGCGKAGHSYSTLCNTQSSA